MIFSIFYFNWNFTGLLSVNEVAQVLALDKSIKTDYVKHTINA